jgi:hypothetical protein
MGGYVLDNFYNRIGQTNWNRLSYMTGSSKSFSDGGMADGGMMANGGSLASIKRMIKKGIPFMVDDNKLFIYHKNKNISFLTSTDIIKKIIDTNCKLLSTLDLEDDFIKEEALKIISSL